MEDLGLLELIKELGFLKVGIIKPQKFPQVEHYKAWLKKGFNGSMGYLSNERRIAKYLFSRKRFSF